MTGEEILSHTIIRSPVCLYRSEWQCCLIYPKKAFKFYTIRKGLLTNLLTYLLHRVDSLFEKLIGLQQVKKFSAFYGTRKFITALISVRQPSLTWASPIQSTYPHPTYWRSIVILCTHPPLGLHSALFPYVFPTKKLYATLFSPIRAI